TGAPAARVPTRDETKVSRLVISALGPRESLELSWKSAAVPTTAPPLLSAQGQITVRLFEEQVHTEAELTVKPLRGPVAEWRFQVPPQASVDVRPSAAEDRPVASIDPVDANQPGIRLLRLKEPSVDPISIFIQLDQKRGQGPIAVGPFAVVGAAQQR